MSYKASQSNQDSEVRSCFAFWFVHVLCSIFPRGTFKEFHCYCFPFPTSKENILSKSSSCPCGDKPTIMTCHSICIRKWCGINYSPTTETYTVSIQYLTWVAKAENYYGACLQMMLFDSKLTLGALSNTIAVSCI